MNTVFNFGGESLEAYSDFNEELTEFGEGAFDTELADPEGEEEFRRGRGALGRTPVRRQRPLRLRQRQPAPARPRPSKRPLSRPRFPRRPALIGRRVVTEPAPCVCPAHGTEFIRWVQSSLNQVLGLNLPVNGIMNTATRSALRRFQEQQGLAVDGIAGPETERALIEAKAKQSGQAEESPESGEFEYLDLGEFEWEDEVKPMRARRKMLQGPFGILTIVAPASLRFTYAFTPEDVLWTARFIVGEAGGRDDPDNRAVIWAMFNRYALFTHKYYKTFHHFLRAYSTPLQPVLKNWRAARRHIHKPEFVRTGGFYKSPPAPPGMPRGQLKRFLNLQSTLWDRLPQSARSLAERALKGQIPNPIGNASEFASTDIFFRHQYKRSPSNDEWRRYTEAYARKQGRIWIGPMPGLNQKKNAFFFAKKSIMSLPKDTVRVRNPASAGFTSAGGGFSFFDFPKAVLEALQKRSESVAIKLAIIFGFRDENMLTNLVFFARHPERKGEKLRKEEPRFRELSREWLDIRNRLVRPALGKLQSSPTRISEGKLDIVSVKGFRVARQIAPQIHALLAAAENDGIKLGGWGYRAHQSQIKLRKKHCGTSYYDIYKKPSGQCRPPTARPGNSMHEKGLAIDFTYNGRGIASQSNPGFIWLSQNAGRFGLKNLPKEPWHWSTTGT